MCEEGRERITYSARHLLKGDESNVCGLEASGASALFDQFVGLSELLLVVLDGIYFPREPSRANGRAFAIRQNELLGLALYGCSVIDIDEV